VLPSMICATFGDADDARLGARGWTGAVVSLAQPASRSSATALARSRMVPS
jgi:hypothetical protein